MVTKDPFISVKLELTVIVAALVVAAWLFGARDLAPVMETLGLLALAAVGALWLAWRTRRVLRLQRRKVDAAKQK